MALSFRLVVLMNNLLWTFESKQEVAKGLKRKICGTDSARGTPDAPRPSKCQTEPFDTS